MNYRKMMWFRLVTKILVKSRKLHLKLKKTFTKSSLILISLIKKKTLDPIHNLRLQKRIYSIYITKMVKLALLNISSKTLQIIQYKSSKILQNNLKSNSLSKLTVNTKRSSNSSQNTLKLFLMLPGIFSLFHVILMYTQNNSHWELFQNWYNLI
jgi:hypothetical protein